MNDATAPVQTSAADRDGADAYAAFWQCIDADEPAEPNVTVDPECSAYEQYWVLFDSD